MGRNRESVRGARLLPDADRRSPKGPTSLSLNGSGGAPFRGARRLEILQPKHRTRSPLPQGSYESLVERIGRSAVPRCAPGQPPASKSLLAQGSHKSIVNGSGGAPFRGARLTSRQPSKPRSPKDPTSRSLTDRAKCRSAVRAWPAARVKCACKPPTPLARPPFCRRDREVNCLVCLPKSVKFVWRSIFVSNTAR